MKYYLFSTAFILVENCCESLKLPFLTADLTVIVITSIFTHICCFAVVNFGP